LLCYRESAGSNAEHGSFAASVLAASAAACVVSFRCIAGSGIGCGIAVAPNASETSFSDRPKTAGGNSAESTDANAHEACGRNADDGGTALPTSAVVATARRDSRNDADEHRAEDDTWHECSALLRHEIPRVRA
jgi:hypothetical protein